jgi:hypothetical protein
MIRNDRNRVRIGVGPGVTRERVEAIKESGIPRDAVAIEDTTPIYPHSTLRDHVRPMPGGVQVEADTGVFSYKICTMGFNAIRAGVSGFVTNSRCTATQGGSTGTDFHQPDDPWWTEGNKVGDEIADPGYFTGGSCPANRRCRFSDSAFVDYTTARGSNIARTVGWNTGSLTISSTNPRLTIVGEMSSWIDGCELDKIGRTTGWAFGTVNGTCQNINVAGTDVTLFCQHRVRRIAGTHSMSDKGDSGSPVFRWQGSGTRAADDLRFPSAHTVGRDVPQRAAVLRDRNDQQQTRVRAMRAEQRAVSVNTPAPIRAPSRYVINGSRSPGSGWPRHVRARA